MTTAMGTIAMSKGKEKEINPNLSSQEKTAAIASTEAALDKGNKRKIMKYAIIGGLVLAGIFIASKIIKNKN